MRNSARRLRRFVLAVTILFACGCGERPAASSEAGESTPADLHAVALPLPGGEAGIGFDDLGFATPLDRLLVPAGRTGNLDLIDPVTRQVVAIPGFSSQARFESGHGEGTTSADFGNGLLFAIDRTARRLVVLDAAEHEVISQAQLAGSPDYVRWVAPTHEVWVTEPDGERIEVFALPAAGRPVPTHQGFVETPGGPESLAIDASRGRAYTHTWTGTTLALDLQSRAIVAHWLNGCAGSRGIALDPLRRFLFVGCAEGRAVVLDIDHGGAILGRLDTGAGVDIISYNPSLGHLYVPGGRSATMAIVGVARTGELSELATVPTARGAHCVVADDHHQAWVCDPDRGQLLLVDDPLPAAEREE